MIRYDITPEELAKRIDAHRPTWRRRARALTSAARKKRRFEGQKIWSEIKRVFMELQHHKCAYCERALGEGEGAVIEYDIEHFRPKNRVRAWPTPSLKHALGLGFPVRIGRSDGYYHLAHEPLNYAVACKRCNSPFKSDHFPIAGTKGRAGARIPTLNARERPLLVFPIGGHDEDPERIFDYRGPVVVARTRRPQDARARQRAEVCIAFFRLNERPDLEIGRAMMIDYLWKTIQARDVASGAARAKQQAIVERLTGPAAPFAGCARAFVSLCARDPNEARIVAELAEEIVARREPGLR